MAGGLRGEQKEEKPVVILQREKLNLAALGLPSVAWRSEPGPKERQGKDCRRSICPQLDERRLVGVVICCVGDRCVCLRSAS